MDNKEQWFVFWVIGSTLSGDRNAGMSVFETEEDARVEMEDIATTHSEYVVVLVHGTEVERISA